MSVTACSIVGNEISDMKTSSKVYRGGRKCWLPAGTRIRCRAINPTPSVYCFAIFSASASLINPLKLRFILVALARAMASNLQGIETDVLTTPFFVPFIAMHKIVIQKY